MTSVPEVVLVARSTEIVKLIDRYANGELSYIELQQAFFDAGWSTLSLYEFIKDIKVEKKE